MTLLEGARRLSLLVNDCGKCPMSDTFLDHRSIGLMCSFAQRAFERDQGSARYPSPPPHWCPLPKEGV